MKNIFKIFLIIFAFCFIQFAEALSTTTGFIPGQIWYSKDPFMEGDTIKIYTALWNNTEYPLSAKVEFYDKNVILGTRDVNVPASSLKDVYVSWKVTAGDHSITAKITSPTITSSGKKESVSVDNKVTDTDKRFVAVVVKKIDGESATSSDVIKNQVDKATSSIGEIVPNSVSDKAKEGVDTLDGFRSKTFDQISDAQKLTKEKIEEIKEIESGKTDSSKNSKTKTGVDVATEKPITQLKYIFLSILAVIFGSKIIFYSLIVLIVLMIMRTIYRKIRHRY